MQMFISKRRHSLLPAIIFLMTLVVVLTACQTAQFTLAQLPRSYRTLPVQPESTVKSTFVNTSTQDLVLPTATPESLVSTDSGQTATLTEEGQTDFNQSNVSSAVATLFAANAADFGPDTCIEGFVWREACGPADHVCVLPEVKEQAQRDNDAAASRVQPAGGPWGPDTCIQGYVWREACGSEDRICVAPDVRDATLEDNRRANERKKYPYCSIYAVLASFQSIESNALQCGFTGARWQADFNAHFQWCLAVGSDATESERRIRELQLGSCRPRILETLTDRCSGDVFISSVYVDSFDPRYPPTNGLLLQRGSSLSQNWSGRMKVDGHTHIRWFCRSTTGNWADPGTWRIADGKVYGAVCGSFDETSGYIQGEPCKPEISGSVTTSAVGGWTPERSRCDSSETRFIDARLGPNRLLEMRCWNR